MSEDHGVVILHFILRTISHRIRKSIRIRSYNIFIHPSIMTQINKPLYALPEQTSPPHHQTTNHKHFLYFFRDKQYNNVINDVLSKQNFLTMYLFREYIYKIVFFSSSRDRMKSKHLLHGMRNSTN